MGGEISNQHPYKAFGERIYKAHQQRNLERTGFSVGSSSDCLTDEQREDLIAENIFDWWQSGKSYKKWYAEKFLQTKINFNFNDNGTD